ncbi:hypothetical protein MF406_07575 [Georgenia sp. TF02-10]|uniref:hypothetical protein n=1 Tax=Georgenia sp. TF02-10 TaxID=2917725 RepID=UPI001FA7FF9C|nr:hypothetical protein [Georgenia sp. TF02-10]UNX56058.1 hypothetical protein MF406_07575 [Georgenia sp. TF02-10]
MPNYRWSSQSFSDVTGVNAIVPGSVIEPHAGMAIQLGENRTGKTGYSRIFKSLAGSRTADTILGDIVVEEDVLQSAKVEYIVGADAKTLVWAGEQGVARSLGCQSSIASGELSRRRRPGIRLRARRALAVQSRK